MQSRSLPPTSFSPWRRLLIAGSTATATICVLALALMVNYLAHHYAPRYHWGAANDYRLSPLTEVALQSLTNRVQVTVFFDREDPVYASVRALLREYTALSPRIEIRELDYTLYPAAAQEFRRRFPFTVSGEDPNLILFESGGHTKVVPARDLRDYDTRALLRGEKEVQPVAFKGELLFTSAINAVCEGRRRRVFFLTGHREHDIQSQAQPTGYRHLAAILQEDNIEVDTLSLAGKDEITLDCEVLIIAGTMDRLSDSESEAIDRYLRRGGRLLVLFQYRAQTGLEELLHEWGISVGDTLVLDEENSEQGVMIVSRFGHHPVTRPLGGSRLYLYLPRAVEPRPVANILGAPARIEPLLYSGTNAIVVSSSLDTDLRTDPGGSRQEVPLAVAVERGALPGVAAHLGTTRIVVVGESSFLANQFIQLAGNRHFAVSTVNWLLDRSHLLGGIQPMPIHTYQISMTPFEQRMLRSLLLGIFPGVALGVGFLVWWRRH
jgi:hypothetical protein